jgi:N-acetylglucosaminylphosphatidylinositol deacetylase
MALIVTAHPDDETMFFAPTVLHLVEQGLRVALLCLSTGSSECIRVTRNIAQLAADAASWGSGTAPDSVASKPASTHSPMKQMHPRWTLQAMLTD